MPVLPPSALALLTLASPLGAQSSEDVRFENGALVLAGELLLPATDARQPAAVVLQGSGESDRTNAWSRAIAEELRGSGLVVLLTDKRGCGASRGDWRTAGFDELADDALAAVRFLAQRPEVDPARIGLVGLSQGGWVAPLAAARSDDVAFVIDVSGCAVSFAEQTALEMRNTARQAGFGDEQVAEVLELHRLAGRYAAGGPWEPYAAARARALEGPVRRVAEGFPPEPDLAIWTFLRKVGGFDPLPAWLLVDVPALVFYGAEDERDNVPVAESVRRLERAFELSGSAPPEIHVIPGVGHALLETQERFAPAFTDGLARWIAETLEP